MSRRARKILQSYNCFFITSSFNGRKNLLINDKYYNIIIESLLFYLNKYKADLITYVLMPNHIHLIIFFNEEPFVSEFMRDFKKFTSKEIRNLLTEEKRNDILEELKFINDEQLFKVWNDRFDAVIIKHKLVLFTKMKYIHFNPVKRGLVAEIDKWKYSSARFYLYEEDGPLPIKHAGSII